MRVGLLAPERGQYDSFQHRSDWLFQRSGNNTGNFAFIEALCRHCAPAVEILPWHVEPEEARRKADILVFAAANQLGAHNDLGWLAERLEKIALPIVAVGLGAQAPDMDSGIDLPAGTERWIRAVAALAPGKSANIGVRGEFTLKFLQSIGLGNHAVVTGCPSNFLNDAADFYPSLTRSYQSRSVERIAVTAGSRHFGAVRDIERCLARLVSETHGAYVTQADLHMLRLSRNEFDRIEAEEFEAIRNFVAPDLDVHAFRIWCRRHAVCFSDATSWMESLRSFDFVLGARFHGVMLAIQAGTAGGVIAHDSRTLELCQTTGVPVRMAGDMPKRFSSGDIRSLFPFDSRTFMDARERLRHNYVQFLVGNGILVNERLRRSQTSSL